MQFFFEPFPNKWMDGLDWKSLGRGKYVKIPFIPFRSVSLNTNCSYEIIPPKRFQTSVSFVVVSAAVMKLDLQTGGREFLTIR